MTSKRDPFADFARMRREMDELLGDFWDQAGSRQSRQLAVFVPRVDVYYCGDDLPKAIVKVELPGIDLEAVNLEVHGRTLVITHLSNELGDDWAREEAERGFGGPVAIAHEGATYEV